MTKTASFLFLIITLSAFSGCGNKNPSDNSTLTLNSLTPDQRAKYCFMNVDHEDDSSVVQQIENNLDGSWQHYPEPGTTDSEDTHRTLKFEFLDGHTSVTLSEYDGFETDIQNFKYKKVCVSTPLDQSAGQFANYQVMEVLSADNQGVAAIAFKIDGAKLYVSDRYYNEYPNFDEPMPTFSSLQSSGNFGKIWVYSERQP
jgi:hypothetical protein